MSESRFDVVIVGYGPVGAMAALTLAAEGLRVVILERDTEICPLPRAVGLDGESMRAFQRLGIASEVEALLQPPRSQNEYCFVDSKFETHFALPIVPCGPNGWRDNAFFDQPELEALLRVKVAAEPQIEVRDACEVTAVEQGADGVRVEATGKAGALEVEAPWLIGCDGASSLVRRSLGIEWASLGYDQEWLVVDITLVGETELPERVLQVCSPERLTTYIPGRDPYRRWEFQALPGETREELLEETRIRELLSRWLSPEHYELRRSAVYQFHAATAGRLRVGRVFLAGDAAHQTPPFLGQGLNSGFRDALNLSWKLSRVHRGLCGDALLDSYEVERDRHARDLVERAVGVGQLMETLAAREAGLPDPYRPEDMTPPPLGEAIVPPLRAGCFHAGQLGEGLPAGRLLRQAVSSQGERFDDRLQPGFVLVQRAGVSLELGPEAKQIASQLGLQTVVACDADAGQQKHDAIFEDHVAALLRPDRILFGAAKDAAGLDALLRDLASQLALRASVA